MMNVFLFRYKVRAFFSATQYLWVMGAAELLMDV